MPDMMQFTSRPDRIRKRCAAPKGTRDKRAEGKTNPAPSACVEYVVRRANVPGRGVRVKIGTVLWRD